MSLKSVSRLVVVPSDPLEAYVRKGRGPLLFDYYNPAGLFSEVIILSPYESGVREEFGLHIRGVSITNFKKELRAIRPDIVRAYGGYHPADIVGYNRIWDIPTIVSVHDTHPSLIHGSLRYSDMVLCMSHAVAAQVLKKGVDATRIRVLPNRVDTKMFRPITDPEVLATVAKRFSPGRKYILHVGRKATQKNLETVIAALKYLPEMYCAVFVGQGDIVDYVKSAEINGVSDRCYWIDSIMNNELPIWYSWCECFCVPSLWEGFGIVFIEAAACGAIIITSDIAPMNEYLRHDESALLTERYRDPKVIAESILLASVTPETRLRISSGAIAMARRFDKDIIDKEEIKIYQECMVTARMNVSISYAIDRILWRLKAGAFAKIISLIVRRFIRKLRKSTQ